MSTGTSLNHRLGLIEKKSSFFTKKSFEPTAIKFGT